MAYGAWHHDAAGEAEDATGQHEHPDPERDQDQRDAEQRSHESEHGSDGSDQSGGEPPKNAHDTLLTPLSAVPGSPGMMHGGRRGGRAERGAVPSGCPVPAPSRGRDG